VQGQGLWSWERLSIIQKAAGRLKRVPNESVDFLDGVLNLVIGVGRLNPQLENQSVELVYNKGDLDALLKSVSDNLFCVYHDLEWTKSPAVSVQRKAEW